MNNHEQLMRGLTLHHYQFTIRARESIVFADHAGSALRGALYQALSENFCSEPFGVVTPEHQAHCPVCWLLAQENVQANRGQNIPRPITIEPPIPRVYQRGEILTFGLTLIGRAQDLFVYLARSGQLMGEIGVGRGRGRFKLENIAEYHPIFDTRRNLLRQYQVKNPTLQLTPRHITEAAEKGDPERITIELLSPLRLVAHDQLVKRPDPRVFIQRLIERCQSLATHYGETEAAPREAWLDVQAELLACAEQTRIAYDETVWDESWSGSARLQRYTPISGLMGRFRWEGPIAVLRPWLLWGQSLHVGKDAVKGNGWYRILV